MQTATSAPPIERELHIDATPETVYGYFTDRDKLLRWMGRKAEVDARPGGALRIDYNGFDIMRGQYRELVPYSRIVLGWGWETLGDAPAPGESTIEVTLTPERGGTRLRLVHSGLSETQRGAHLDGWDSLLPILSAQATGAPAPAVPTPALSQAEELASRLNTALVRLRYTIEGSSPQAWQAKTAEGWTVAATADHAVFHTGVVGLARAVADGQHPSQADITLDQLSHRNDERAAEQAAAPREAVLGTLLTEGPKAVEAVKAFSDADLARSITLAAAGGAPVSVAGILAGPLVGNIEEHTASIEAAVAGSRS
jgi:uncharacterized protein YndB with AHSA1/START domain